MSDREQESGRRPAFFCQGGQVFCGGAGPRPGLRISEADGRALLGTFTDELRAALEAQDAPAAMGVARMTRDLISARLEAGQQGRKQSAAA